MRGLQRRGNYKVPEGAERLVDPLLVTLHWNSSTDHYRLSKKHLKNRRILFSPSPSSSSCSSSSSSEVQYMSTVVDLTNVNTVINTVMDLLPASKKRKASSSSSLSCHALGFEVTNQDLPANSMSSEVYNQLKGNPDLLMSVLMSVLASIRRKEEEEKEGDAKKVRR